MLRSWFIFILFLQNQTLFASNWIAFGDLRGTMEPCGCDPSSDLGGMLRLGAFVNQVKQIDKKTLVLVAGKITAGENIMVNNSVAQSLSALNVSAALPSNEADIKYFLDYKIPFVFSNSLEKNHPKSKIEEDVCILGFASYGQELTDDFLAKNQLGKGLCQGSQKNVIILTDMAEKEIYKLTSAYRPSIVLRASSRDLTVKPDGAERRDPAAMVVGVGGVNTFQMPLGGAGVWVSENLFQIISHMNSVFSKKAGCNEPSKLPGITSCKNIKTPLSKISMGNSDLVSSPFLELPIVWLDKSYQQKPSLVDAVLKKYRKFQRDKFIEYATSGRKSLEKSSFVGSAACKTCHKQAYEIWEKSKHSKAIQVLIDAKKNEEFECVGCHVVGYGEKGGYLDEAHTPHLSSVGCESCHGAGKDHVSNPQLNLTKGGRYVCINCHVDGHSPHFDLSKYWPQIKHGNEGVSSKK